MTRIPERQVNRQTSSANLHITHNFAIAPPVALESATTFTKALLVPHFTVSTTTPGANKIAEYSVFSQDGNAGFLLTRNGDLFSHAFRYGCYIQPFQRDNPTATMYTGIEIGTMGALPWTGGRAGKVVQLRYGGTATLGGVFELAYADEVNAPVVAPTLLIGAAPIVSGAYFELIYDPFNKVVSGIIDGIEVARLEGNTIPDFMLGGVAGLSSTLVLGIFQTTGTDAAGGIGSIYSAPNLEVINPYSQAAYWKR